MTPLQLIQKALIEGSNEEITRLTKQALEENHAPGDILANGLIAAMEIIGERFRLHEIFLPDVLIAARAMNAGLGILQPYLEGDRVHTRGTVVIGTVEGDLHDIGKNLVGILLRGAGFRVVDLGNNVSPGRFVEGAKAEKADVVGMSALLTTTMPVMGRVTAALLEAGLNGIRTIVGGAPVSESFAREIGADGYGYDASRAVSLLKEWMP